MNDTITDKTGIIYSGVFLNKNEYILHGKGEIKTPNGFIYKGYFINGKKNGLFKVQIKDEVSYIIYENDKVKELY
jgi:hypothetical protein